MNRIALIRIIATIILCLFFLILSKNAKLVPNKKQSFFELAMNFIYEQICVDVLGESAAKRFFPYIASVFFGVFFLNITGIIPFLNVSSNSLVAFPLILAICSWVMFIFAGIKHNGAGKFFKNSLFPTNVPKPVYIILTPIEFISTFVLRPATLTVRLMANMISGHLLLGVFYAMTSYLLIVANIYLKPIALISFFACFVFVLFEIFVAALQSYIFALLSTIYISLARSPH
jgi:F-type H+-transporting ATPase subunit a